MPSGRAWDPHPQKLEEEVGSKFLGYTKPKEEKDMAIKGWVYKEQEAAFSFFRVYGRRLDSLEVCVLLDFVKIACYF